MKLLSEEQVSESYDDFLVALCEFHTISAQMLAQTRIFAINELKAYYADADITEDFLQETDFMLAREITKCVRYKKLVYSATQQ